MFYATVTEFVEHVGEAEARALAPAPGPGARDDARILDAIGDASATLDTYLATRFPVPIAPVPRALGKAAIDLAREQLDRSGRDFVKAAADRVRAWARDVSKGVATLGSAADGETDPLPPSSGGPAVHAARPTFDDDTLSGYQPRYAGGWG